MVLAAVSSQSPSWWLQTPPHLSTEATALVVWFGLVLGPAVGLLLTSGLAGTGSNWWAARGSPHRWCVSPQSHACEVLNLQLVCPRLLLYIYSLGGQEEEKKQRAGVVLLSDGTWASPKRKPLHHVGAIDVRAAMAEGNPQ